MLISHDKKNIFLLHVFIQHIIKKNYKIREKKLIFNTSSAVRPILGRKKFETNCFPTVRSTWGCTFYLMKLCNFSTKKLIISY